MPGGEAMRPIRSFRAFALWLLVVTSWGVPWAHACDPPRFNSALGAGNWAEALRQSDLCATELMANAPASKRANFSDPDFLSVINPYYWLLGRATLNAKLGHWLQANDDLSFAEAWAKSYSFDQRGPLVDPLSPLDLVRGYIAERVGDLQIAETNYKQVSNMLRGEATARRALLALDRRDYTTAKTLIRGPGGAEEDPTGLYVLGMLAEHRGEKIVAIGFFERALREIGEVSSGNNGLLPPMCCLERDRINEALKQARAS